MILIYFKKLPKFPFSRCAGGCAPAGWKRSPIVDILVVGDRAVWWYPSAWCRCSSILHCWDDPVNIPSIRWGGTASPADDLFPLLRISISFNSIFQDLIFNQVFWQLNLIDSIQYFKLLSFTVPRGRLYATLSESGVDWTSGRHPHRKQHPRGVSFRSEFRVYCSTSRLVWGSSGGGAGERTLPQCRQLPRSDTKHATMPLVQLLYWLFYYAEFRFSYFVGAPGGEVGVPVVQFQLDISDSVSQIPSNNAAFLLATSSNRFDIKFLTYNQKEIPYFKH